MTRTLPGADIRGYYQALGVELPGGVEIEVSVRCFSDPQSHANEDRNASCSVNLQNGAWHCWGCGAKGGAYDAATRLGRSPRQAIDLMVQYGLTERRGGRQAPRQTATSSAGVHSQPAAPSRVTTRPRALAVTEDEVREWHQQLVAQRWPLAGLRGVQQRLWRRQTAVELGLGWDLGRVTIALRGGAGELLGVLRYAPRHDRAPKMLAVAGTTIGLVPHPAAERSGAVVLVEGPPDMISARSCGLPAIAVPGDDAWQPEWAALLAGRRVAIAMDCDQAGRAAANRIARDLNGAGALAHVVELAPDRDDGYDLTDWLADQHPISSGAVRSTFFPAGLPPHHAAASRQPQSGAEPSEVAEAIRLASVAQSRSPTQALSNPPAQAHRAASARSGARAPASKRAGR